MIKRSALFPDIRIAQARIHYNYLNDGVRLQQKPSRHGVSGGYEPLVSRFFVLRAFQSNAFCSWLWRTASRKSCVQYPDRHGTDEDTDAELNKLSIQSRKKPDTNTMSNINPTMAMDDNSKPTMDSSIRLPPSWPRNMLTKQWKPTIQHYGPSRQIVFPWPFHGWNRWI